MNKFHHKIRKLWYSQFFIRQIRFANFTYNHHPCLSLCVYVYTVCVNECSQILKKILKNKI